MAGSREGGLKAAQKILEKDPDHYKRIGAKGGRNGTTGGFAAATPAQRREWGAKGGKISRRNKNRREEKLSLWRRASKAWQ